MKIQKPTFGCYALGYVIESGSEYGEPESIEVCGFCTDICVVSNVLMLRAHFPNTPITVDAACCAGVTPEKHKAALEVMKSCQIANKEVWKDEEYHKQRAALYKEQWKDPDKRKRRSEQAKKRWADEGFHKKAQQAVLNACKTAVICIETGERFESITEVCNKYNIHHSNVCRAIRKGGKSGGYHWKYAS